MVTFWHRALTLPPKLLPPGCSFLLWSGGVNRPPHLDCSVQHNVSSAPAWLPYNGSPVWWWYSLVILDYWTCNPLCSPSHHRQSSGTGDEDVMLTCKILNRNRCGSHIQVKKQTQHGVWLCQRCWEVKQWWMVLDSRPWALIMLIFASWMEQQLGESNLSCCWMSSPTD